MAQPAKGVQLAGPFVAGRNGVKYREALDVDTVALEHPAPGIDVECDRRIGSAQIDGCDGEAIRHRGGIAPAIEQTGVKAEADGAARSAQRKT